MTPENTCSPAEHTFSVISHCYDIVRWYFSMLTDFGREHRLSKNEMAVLVVAIRHPELNTERKLVQRLDLSVSSVCRAIDTLRQRGYLTTDLDQNDRRSWIITPEPAGQDLVTQFLQTLYGQWAQLGETEPAGLPDEASFAAFLSHIKKQLA